MNTQRGHTLIGGGPEKSRITNSIFCKMVTIIEANSSEPETGQVEIEGKTRDTHPEGKEGIPMGVSASALPTEAREHK